MTFSTFRSGPLAVLVLLAACGGGEDPVARSEESPSEPRNGNPPSGQTTATPPAPTAGPETTETPEPPTPTFPTVRFVAMGDTGTGSNAQQKVGNTIAAKCAQDGCDFIQLLGDNLYDSGASSTSDPIWQEKFEIPYAAVDLPFYAVLGNHDYGHDGAGTDFLKGPVQVAYTNVSTKWKMPAAYYHFTKGPLEIFALDTNMMMFSQAGQQQTQMAAWIAASTSPWKIAVGHHPYKSNGPHGNAGIYDNVPIPGPWTGKGVKDFLESTVCGKVDLYLSGHDHSRQWLNESCAGTQLAVSGAGAKATKLGGGNPTLFQSLELGFLYIVVEEKKLTAQFVDENGNVEFTHVVAKP